MGGERGWNLRREGEIGGERGWAERRWGNWRREEGMGEERGGIGGERSRGPEKYVRERKKGMIRLMHAFYNKLVVSIGRPSHLCTLYC